VNRHSQRRFDICVWNFRRLELFLDNFERIQRFDRERDRLTVVSCSPSAEEAELLRRFEARTGTGVRYLTRENRGIDQLARCDYFTGRVGSLDENLSYAYIFQMQEHYLDTESSASRWGPEFDGALKSDTVPDDLVFDLDRMEGLAVQHDLHGFFADRANPCYVEVDGRRYIAPCGGNFVIRTDLVADASAQEAFQHLIRTCDDTYSWAVYAEFKWGPIFFHEGRRFWDLKRDRLYDSWSRDEFYLAPDDYPALMRRYERALALQRLGAGYRRGRAYLAHVGKSVLRPAG
jgi:hypothetical protein